MNKINIASRWLKIINDIWGNKPRSLLVVLSIAVGVGVVGMINNARLMIERDLYGTFHAGNPASVMLYISPFPKELSHAVNGMRQVQQAQARRVEDASIIRQNGDVVDLSLSAVPDFDDLSINIPQSEAGFVKPGLRQIVIERQAAKTLDIAVGDELLIELPDGERYTLQVSGIVHDIYDLPYSIKSTVESYVEMSTLQWMGFSPYYNRLDLVVVDGDLDREHVLSVAADIRDRVIEPAGYVVGSIQIPGIESDPGQHWAQNQIHGFVLILQVMSVLAIFLSGGLVVNTISAILTQQVKQIGIMRSLGAVPKQIAGMYIFNIFIFSILGLLIAIPIGWFGSLWLSQFAAGFLNFKVTSIGLFPQILIMQTLLALVVPVGVALYPIMAGTAISVYQAIYQYGLIREGQKGWMERLLEKLTFLKPPSVLSLLNTFRNIPRLSFTLITLTLAGATFVASFSTRSSLNAQVKQIGRYVDYDVAIPINANASRYTAEREAFRIPAVVAAEGWASITSKLSNPDGSEEETQIIGLPYDSIMLRPKMIKGRWLVAEDAYQVVVNEDLIQTRDVSIGDPIQVKVHGVNRELTIIGITSKTLRGPTIFLNYSTFTKLTGRSDQVNQVRIRTDLNKIARPEVQDALAAQLEERFSNAGLSDSSAQTNHQSYGFFSEPFKIILMILVIMAGLLAVVGGLSLAGTMSINVMERTREIGVLRSVGASNKAIRQVVVVEGMLIAVLSWLLVLLISGPSSASLAGAVIYTILNTRLTFRYSFLGLFLWLLIVAIIGAVSSLAPAQNAVTLTVREVLDYE